MMDWLDEDPLLTNTALETMGESDILENAHNSAFFDLDQQFSTSVQNSKLFIPDLNNELNDKYNKLIDERSRFLNFVTEIRKIIRQGEQSEQVEEPFAINTLDSLLAEIKSFIESSSRVGLLSFDINNEYFVNPMLIYTVQFSDEMILHENASANLESYQFSQTNEISDALENEAGNIDGQDLKEYQEFKDDQEPGCSSFENNRAELVLVDSANQIRSRLDEAHANIIESVESSAVSVQENLETKSEACTVNKNSVVEHISHGYDKNNANGQWKCLCGKQLKALSTLQMHIKRLTHDWKLQCTICDRKFFYLSHLKQHLTTTHQKRNPLKEYKTSCFVCGQFFEKTKDCLRHLKHCKLHSMFTRVKCDQDLSTKTNDITTVAGLPFQPQPSSSSHNIRRERVGQKPEGTEQKNLYSCDDCGNAYVTGGGLYQHKRIKKFGNIYGCRICSKRFFTLASIKRHVSQIHKSRFTDWLCGKCEKQMSSAHVFTEHLKTEHFADF